MGEPTERVHLRCSFCGHWEVGPRTKAQIAAWLRIHKAATLGTDTAGPDRQSICPHPCGTEPDMASAVLGDDRPAPCECCDNGISNTTGEVCVACDGFGWREP